MKRRKEGPVVFNDPATSLRKATTLSEVEKENARKQFMSLNRSMDLPTVIIGGTTYYGQEYKAQPFGGRT